MALIQRLQALPTVAIDVIITVVVAYPTAMDAWWNEQGTRQADGLTYALTVTSIVVLLVRRRWPIPVALVSGAALSGLYVLGHHGELLNLPVMVALYTVAVQGDRRSTLLTGVVAGTWSGVLGFTSDDPIGARGGSPVLEVVWPLIPLAFGEAARARRELLTFAAAEREREADRRVEEERARMARELHDVVAHTMVAVNVQMAAAAAAFDLQPETARAALLEARASSKAALQELRATVALMRGDHDTAPAPRLAQLGELAETARAAGIDVTVDDGRDGMALPGSVELAAYRVVQEALTNVVRHSDARHAAVSLRVGPGGLSVEVVDDGTARPADRRARTVGGFGLVGMDERVRALGGRLEHGRTPQGGYRVHALLPAPEEVP